MNSVLKLCLLLLILLSPAVAYPGEVSGVVSYVVEGDTIDVTDFGRVRLADIETPEILTPDGQTAKQYTVTWLQSNLVYLHVDNISRIDRYGRYIAEVYLADPDRSLNVSRSFNRMIVDARHACIRNFTDNEFDPADWWGGAIHDTACIKESFDWRSTFASEGYTNQTGDHCVVGERWVGNIWVDEAEYWFSKGNSFYDIGNYKTALDCYEKAISLMPERADLWFNKGNVLLKLKRYGDAVAAYNNATARNPNHAKAWKNKGQAYEALGMSAEAEAAFAKARELGLS